MNVAELLEKRKPEWKELEDLLDETKKVTSNSLLFNPEKASRFTMLYRSVCSDLALAESYELPPGTIHYLNGIVGRAHHYLYCSSRSGWKNFQYLIFTEIPRWILTDFTFWLAFILFWGPFFTCLFMSHLDTSFPERVISGEQLKIVEKMYGTSFDQIDFDDRMFMVGYYIRNNGGIGLQCFAMGIIGGICGAMILLSNSIQLGVIFGYMTSSLVDPQTRTNFTTFVLAHSSFELTAIVMSAAAGMRLGFAFFVTHGYRRIDSVRLAARKAGPIMMVAFVLFCLAALIEGIISPNPFLSLGYKQGIAIVTGCMLFIYIVVLGGISQYRALKNLPVTTVEEEQ